MSCGLWLDGSLDSSTDAFLKRVKGKTFQSLSAIDMYIETPTH